MKFLKLAQLFSKLEDTTKRLEMIDILASFFREIKEKRDFSDLEKIIYMLQGQLKAESSLSTINPCTYRYYP